MGAATEASARPVQLRLFALLTFTLLAGSLSGITLPPNTDIGWVVQNGQRLVEGERMYRDIIDIHPPLVFWESGAVMWVARLLDADPLIAYDVFVLLHVWLGVVLTWAVTRRWLEPAVAAIALLPVIGVDFGEGEHLLLAGLIPYLLLASRRTDGAGVSPWLATAIGGLFGVGIAAKPHFMMPWLVLLAFDARRNGTQALRRPEVSAVVAVGLIYIASVLILAPEYFPYLRWAYPAYQQYFPSEPLVLLRRWRGQLAIGGLCLLLVVDRSRNGIMVAVTTATLLLAAFMQGKGWTYHWYPAIALMSFHGLRIALTRKWAAVLAVPVLAIAMLWTQYHYYDLRHWPYMMPWTRRVVEEYGGPVLGLTTIMQPVYPMVNILGVRSASRFGSLWPIPSGYAERRVPFRYNRPEEMGYAEHYGFEAIISDFLKYRPAVVFVDTLPLHWRPRERRMEGFLWLEYLNQDERFRAAFGSYVELDRISNYRVFVKRSQP